MNELDSVEMEALTPEQRAEAAKPFLNALSTLPLHRIEAELMELLALAEQPELDTEARAAVDTQIAAYFQAEVRKVDSIASAIHKCDSALSEIGEEIRRLRKMEDSWQARMTRIKEATLRAMQAHGVRVLETHTNKLRVQGNGGARPLEIDPNRDPDEYCDITVKLPLTTWCDLVKAAVQARVISEQQAKRLEDSANVEPNTTLIRGALKSGQKVAGARLLERGAHLRIE